MNWLTIELLRSHVRVDNDCENSLLVFYGEAAEKTVLNVINTSYEQLMEEYGSVPEPIQQASLQIVDESYKHRSPTSHQPQVIVPFGLEMALRPYVRL
ncbi:MAG: phage gp6-like head-tail connector protein [Prevotella sp.]|nr:phage gp6-like head-tail connector protein [Prevotella sp.]